MKLIVGLGNPGQKYEGTRHNAGFMFLDKLAGELGATFSDIDKFDAKIAETKFQGDKIILVKPQTYMNLSGSAVSMIMSYYKISPDDLVVVSDDIDLPVGNARIRQTGSSGGQKGLQNIIDMIDTNDFVRIRIGIQSVADNENEATRMNNIDTADFVLSKFSNAENKIINEVIETTILYAKEFLGNNEKIPAHSIVLER